VTPRTTIQKTETISNKNTFYFVNSDFENNYESYIQSLISETIDLQLKIQEDGCTEKVISDFIVTKNGLTLLLAYTALSFETLTRIVTYIRKTNNKNINTFFNKDKWNTVDRNGFKEWNGTKIEKLIKTNQYFRESIVKLFFFGYNIPNLNKILPTFELKKLNPSKIHSIAILTEDIMDTMIRYKEKGSYSAQKENNSEIVIEHILDEYNVPYTRGDLPLLIENEMTRKRTMDFIIPNKENPKIIIESSYVSTTASGLGDKAKTENGIKHLLKEYYPESKFFGFIDGVGWISRHKDAERMCEAFDDVYTYHSDELDRFKETLKEILPEYYKNA
jgi:hypothetical protein